MQRQRFGREGAEFGRGLGFFDAIHGFAITLLITNIDLPQAPAWSSLSTLLSGGLGAQLLGFLISFVVIAAFWRRSTELLSRFSAIDSSVITTNLVAAGLVVLLPFTTQGISDPLLAEYALPVALYAANVALVIIAHAAIFEAGRSRGLLRMPVSEREMRAERADALAKVVVFGASIPVAYLCGPGWGMLTWLLLLVVGPVFGRRVAKAAAESFETPESLVDPGLTR